MKIQFSISCRRQCLQKNHPLPSFIVPTHVCLFNFVLCQKVSCSCVSFPAATWNLSIFQQTLFRPPIFSIKFFPSEKRFYCDDTAMVLYWQIILTMLNGKWNWVDKMIAMWTNQGRMKVCLRCELMCDVMKNNVKNRHRSFYFPREKITLKIVNEARGWIKHKWGIIITFLHSLSFEQQSTWLLEAKTAWNSIIKLDLSIRSIVNLFSSTTSYDALKLK